MTVNTHTTKAYRGMKDRFFSRFPEAIQRAEEAVKSAPKKHARKHRDANVSYVKTIAINLHQEVIIGYMFFENEAAAYLTYLEVVKGDPHEVRQLVEWLTTSQAHQEDRKAKELLGISQ
ncbi:MAG: hypothetical protein AAGA15_04165 [Pseudomonadota bacterium]